MLDAALKVVEAARALGLIEQGGITRSPLDRHTLALNLSALRASIETFDHDTAAGFNTPEYLAKPNFATPPQLDDEGSQEMNINLTPDFLPGPEAAMRREVLKNDPEQKLSAELTNILNNKPAVTALTSPVIIPGMRRDSKPGLNADYSDLDDTLLFDNDESVGDFMLAIDRIEDKMGYAIQKNGWNPRLKSLAHAVMEMRKRLILEVRQDGALITIPAHVFSGLTSTIADAVLDADMKMLVPQLKLSKDQTREKELEYVRTPKPPGYFG
ncbi:hypothetical protein [Rhizobium sp. MHM7A]|uniref:hypothetical protein n=1 Tax=Rhizobium sp. MHM7A TaxID=2583233 RepID=UPI001106F754|nr:hypothetical protein [Rhizobium sp. MHM7A]TLX16953.1 hypothetical protein FFR93_06325 [Rhizobium sp. MHM7A]